MAFDYDPRTMLPTRDLVRSSLEPVYRPEDIHDCRHAWDLLQDAKNKAAYFEAELMSERSNKLTAVTALTKIKSELTVASNTVAGNRVLLLLK